MGYAHVFLSQMESILQIKSPASPEQLALTLTLVISATNFGEIIGITSIIQVPLPTNPYPINTVKLEP